ncbi:MAG TPA: methyltransferase domain-containing protein [Gaiellaceae bacterium]|nr:methyltransferase domain-containing protein [Gaiellaceae bacterium]
MNDLLETQKRYYAARAPEYEDWWYRRGRYELPPERKAAWQADVAEVEAALDDFGVHGDVLELAAGTGIWTRRLVAAARRVVALDANPETLALNTPRADLRVVDLFAWEPDEQFDLCFFGFWISHVPAERFDAFWSTVRAALRPDGRVFLVDGLVTDPTHLWENEAWVETRTVADGREFRIVKKHWRPDELAGRVRPLGFELDLRATANGHFVYGGGR